MTTEQAINEIVSSGYGQVQCHEETMRMAVDALRAQQWISVKDKKPKEMECVNVTVVDDVGDNIYKFVIPACRVTGDIWISDNDRVYGVTHWMPLPEPPKEAQKCLSD